MRACVVITPLLTDVVSEQQIARCVVPTTVQSLYNRRKRHSEQTLYRTVQCWALWFLCWFSAESKAFLACHCCCHCRLHDRQYSFANWLTRRPAGPCLWQFPLYCSVCYLRRCMIWQDFTTSQRRQPAQTRYEGKVGSSDLPAIYNEFPPHIVSTRIAHNIVFLPYMCRQSEASAHLGAILTGYDLVAMFLVRKLGLSLGKLDDVTLSLIHI